MSRRASHLEEDAAEHMEERLNSQASSRQLATSSLSDGANSDEIVTPRIGSGRLDSSALAGTSAASSSFGGSDAEAEPEADALEMEEQALAATRSSGQKPKRYPKIPKLPMAKQGNRWYRARLIQEKPDRVLLGAPYLVICGLHYGRG